MKKLRALDLFCGAGGASMGLHQAGFEVTGIDIKPQPRYPFNFIQADALNSGVRLTEFDFIWASPPCQAFTKAQKLRGNSHPDLIEPIRAMLMASGVPYAIENVPGAPLMRPTILCGSMFGLRTYRHRLIETSFPCEQLLCSHIARITKMGRPPQEGEFMHIVGNFSGIAEAKKAMDIDWMKQGELSQSIPPAYSKFIAQQALKSIGRAILEARAAG